MFTARYGLDIYTRFSSTPTGNRNGAVENGILEMVSHNAAPAYQCNSRSPMQLQLTNQDSFPVAKTRSRHWPPNTVARNGNAGRWWMPRGYLAPSTSAHTHTHTHRHTPIRTITPLTTSVLFVSHEMGPWTNQQWMQHPLTGGGTEQIALCSQQR